MFVLCSASSSHQAELETQRAFLAEAQVPCLIYRGHGCVLSRKDRARVKGEPQSLLKRGFPRCLPAPSVLLQAHADQRRAELADAEAARQKQGAAVDASVQQVRESYAIPDSPLSSVAMAHG